jgi:alpha-1,6-mannosyltransferase
MTRARLMAAGLVIETGFLSLYAVPPGAGRVLWFIVVQLLAALLVGWLLLRIRTEKPAASHAVVVAGFALLFRLTLVPASPVASDDIYRYLWDGRVTVHGENPFLHAPNDPLLSSLATADLPARVSSPGMRTAYPAGAQALFAVSATLFGPSIPGLKFLLVLADMASIGLLALLVQRFRLPPLAVLAYAWSPLPVLYVALDGHVDALGIPLMLAAVYCVLDARFVRAMVALAGAALVKLYPLLIAPLIVPRRLRSPALWLSLLPLAAFGAVSWSAARGSWALLASMQAFGARWEFNGPVFTLAYKILGSNEGAHIASGAMLGLWCVVLFFLRRAPEEKAFLAFLGIVLLGPLSHPWYFLWVGALLVIRWSTATFTLLGLTALSNIIVYRYQAYGRWEDDLLVLALEYIPFLVLLVAEIVRGEFGNRTGCREGM